MYKATIGAAAAKGGLRNGAMFPGTIDFTPKALVKLVTKLGDWEDYGGENVVLGLTHQAEQFRQARRIWSAILRHKAPAAA